MHRLLQKIDLKLKKVEKDVEKLFRDLQGRFKILRHEYHEWRHETISGIVSVRVILHNMLVSLRLNGLLENEESEYGGRLTSLQFIEEFEITLAESVDNCITQTHYEWLEELIGVEGSI